MHNMRTCITAFSRFCLLCPFNPESPPLLATGCRGRSLRLQRILQHGGFAGGDFNTDQLLCSFFEHVQMVPTAIFKFSLLHHLTRRLADKCSPAEFHSNKLGWLKRSCAVDQSAFWASSYPIIEFSQCHKKLPFYVEGPDHLLHSWPGEILHRAHPQLLWPQISAWANGRSITLNMNRA